MFFKKDKGLLKKYRKELIFLIILIIIGQVIFGIVSKNFTTPHWESRIYATTGVKHDTSDLHRLNEAAHYFGQTMIGWTKFPHFMSDLSELTDLPEGSSVNAHMQERQNIIFTVYTPEPIAYEKLLDVKDYIQYKMDEYNNVNRTLFVLSSLDYEQIEVSKTYQFGAIVALLTSLVIGLGFIFVRREFFV